MKDYWNKCKARLRIYVGSDQLHDRLKRYNAPSNKNLQVRTVEGHELLVSYEIRKLLVGVEAIGLDISLHLFLVVLHSLSNFEVVEPAFKGRNGQGEHTLNNEVDVNRSLNGVTTRILLNDLITNERYLCATAVSVNLNELVTDIFGGILFIKEEAGSFWDFLIKQLSTQPVPLEEASMAGAPAMEIWRLLHEKKLHSSERPFKYDLPQRKRKMKPQAFSSIRKMVLTTHLLQSLSG